MKLTKKTEKTKYGIEFPIWGKKALDKFPITKQTIGRPVKLASDPKSKDYILLEIKEVGDPGFPRGGYLVETPETAFPKPVYLEEAIEFPPKKKRKRKRRKRKTKP